VVDNHRKVSTIGLLLIGFFWCSGGIYGNESLLEAAPTGFAFLALILGSVFYALPIAVISAELACAVPYDGGLVAWVEEACGARIGGHNVWWLWIS
jgi:amino acid transporter